MLLDQLIDGRALVSEAHKSGLDKDPAVQRQVTAAEDRALQTAVLSKEVGPIVTDEAVRARYDQDIAGKPGEEEVHAKHILVDNEAEAKKIIADLKGGGDFAALAKQYSKDPGGAQQGGDLGFFKKDEMVPEFADRCIRAAARPGFADAGAQPVRLACHPGGGAPPRRAAELRSGARRTAPEDDPGRRAEGGGEGARVGRGGEVQPGRLADRARPTPPNRRPRRRSRSNVRPVPRKPDMATSVSPLAVPLSELPPLAGVRLGAAAAGMRYQGRDDLVMIELAPGTTVAGVFTSNKCPGRAGGLVPSGAEGGRARAVVVNAGNANVFTGKAGRDACAATAAAAGKLVGCPAKQVFIASTGVIGELLPYQKLIDALPALHAGLRDDAWQDAARGIMTTDTFPKAATRTAQDRRGEVRITGIAKGSGMIAPDMATMLCYIVHRREDTGRRAAGAAEEGRRCQLQLHDGGFRHLDLGYRAAVRHRPGEASAGARPKAGGCWPISPAHWTRCCWTSRCRWCATGRGRRSWCAST